MKENNKYYTPSIEEFHIGFECEVSNISTQMAIMDFDKGDVKRIGEKHMIWEPSSFKTLAWFNDSNGLSHQALIKDGRIRVKYLDKEDMESLGFERINFYDDGRGIASYRYEKDHAYIYLLLNNKIKIEFDSGGEIFRGTIKNKSELKRLLKQLGI